MNKQDIINDLALMVLKADPKNCVLMVSLSLMNLIIADVSKVNVRITKEFINVVYKFCNIPIQVDLSLNGYSAYVIKIEAKGEWVLDE